MPTVTPIAKSNQVSQDASGYHATECYQVSGVAGPAAALAASGVPELYDDHGSVSSRVSNRAAVPFGGDEEGAYETFLVTVQYDPPDPYRGGGAGEDPEDPDTWAVQIQGDADLFMRAVDEDLDGKPCQNNVEEKFDPAVEVEMVRPYLELVKPQKAAPHAKARAYSNHVNSSAFWGAGPRTLLCRIGFSSDQLQKKDGTTLKFWQVRHRFSYDKEGWNPTKILNAGYSEVVATDDGDQIVSIRNSDGAIPSSPVAINQNRRRIDINGGQPFYQEFRFKEEADFNQLGLGNSP